MNTLRRRIFLRLATILLAAATVLGAGGRADARSQAYTLWFEPLEIRFLPGAADFDRLFTPAGQAEWPVARGETSVLELAFQNLETQHPGFIENTLAPFLKRNHMRIALNSTASMLASCDRERARGRLEHEIRAIQLLRAAGVSLDYISMQSTFSVGVSRSPGCASYTMSDRINDVAWYIRSIRDRFPDQHIRIGLIDALLTKGPHWTRANLGAADVYDAFTQLLTALRNQGLNIDYVMLDHGWIAFREFNPRASSSVADVRNFETWLKRQGVSSVIILTSGGISNRPFATESDFSAELMQELAALLAGGVPENSFMVTSWFRIPRSNLPESPQDPASFPLTRVLKDVGTYLDNRLH